MNIKRRIIFILFCVVLGVFISVGRFFYLQISNRPEILEKAQSIRTRVKLLPPKRGEIYTSDGVLVAGNGTSIDMLIVPIEVRKKVPQELYIVAENKELVDELLKKTIYYPVPIKTDIEYDELAKILPLVPNLPFIYFELVFKRVYPLKTFASHVLGYVKTERPYEYRGIYGVEAVYDEYIRGEPSRKIVEIDALGREIETVKSEEGQRGQTLWLTIDSQIQALAEGLIKDYEGAIVVMNPHSGEILALVSSPSFDPNSFSRKVERESWVEYISDPRKPLINRAISGEYHPGSVFKLVVAIAALEEGVISKDFRVSCPGKFFFGKNEFRCWKKEGHGSLDLMGSIAKSCDVYFYTLGLKVGIDRIEKWAKKLGLGERTGIDLTFEQPGLIPGREWKKQFLKDKWYEGETISVAVGQSYTTVTAVQIARLTSAIVNGGYLITPHVVKKVGERTLDFPKKKIDVSDETLDIIKEAMLYVVEWGTAAGSKLKMVKYGGKTGTSQVASIRAIEKILGKSWEKISFDEIPKQFRDHAWFTAFAPYENPEIVVSVVVEHCGGGAKCAAPIAKKIIEYYMNSKVAFKVQRGG
jgi:penicillin-binding protein 2